MKLKTAFLVLSMLSALGAAHAAMLTEVASKDSYFSSLSPAFDAGYSGNLTVGGPADIYSAVEFPLNNPAGTVVTNFSIVFDIQETISTGVTTSLNVWALGGPWDETSTRNSIAGYSHIPEGSVTLTTGLLPNGDNSITFSGTNLTSLYSSGALASGMFWQDNDLASVFPNGATAFSNNTPFGEVGTVTYQVPEPSVWATILVAFVVLLFLRCRCHTSTHA